MNGYIRLNIGGKDRGFKFGMFVMASLLDDYNTDLNQVDSVVAKNPYKFTAKLMYYSAVNALKEDEIQDFREKDVYDWIDGLEGGMESEEMNKFSECYLNSRNAHAKKQEPASEGEEEKKH